MFFKLHCLKPLNRTAKITENGTDQKKVFFIFFFETIIHSMTWMFMMNWVPGNLKRVMIYCAGQTSIKTNTFLNSFNYQIMICYYADQTLSESNIFGYSCINTTRFKYISAHFYVSKRWWRICMLFLCYQSSYCATLKEERKMLCTITGISEAKNVLDKFLSNYQSSMQKGLRYSFCVPPLRRNGISVFLMTSDVTSTILTTPTSPNYLILLATRCFVVSLKYFTFLCISKLIKYVAICEGYKVVHSIFWYSWLNEAYEFAIQMSFYFVLCFVLYF